MQVTTIRQIKAPFGLKRSSAEHRCSVQWAVWLPSEGGKDSFWQWYVGGVAGIPLKVSAVSMRVASSSAHKRRT